MCPICKSFAEWLYVCANPDCAMKCCSNCLDLKGWCEDCVDSGAAYEGAAYEQDYYKNGDEEEDDYYQSANGM